MKINDKLPTISVVIPAFNEEINLRRLFSSLKKQTYPKNKIEFIVIDDTSTDNTYNLAKEFGARIISVETHDIELNKGIGMHAAKYELIYWLDADMEICSKDFFQLLAQPLIENKNVIASFTKEFALDCAEEVNNSLLRFISHDPLQRDPIYQFFSPSIEDTIIDKKTSYFICNFQPGRIPPCGRSMYRRKILLSTAVGKDKSFIDLESLEIVARAGYQLFAYVPEAKLRHYHATTLHQLISKRLRNLERDYLPNIGQKYYTWFKLGDPRDFLKIIYWIIRTNLFLPELIVGLIKTLRYRDLVFLWQPIIALLVTDAILFGFISKPSGRSFIFKAIKKIIN